MGTNGYLKRHNFIITFSVLLITFIAGFNISDIRGVLLLSGILYLYAMLFFTNKSYRLKRKQTIWLLFFVVWLVYALIQFLFTDNSSSSVSHILSLTFGLGIIFIMTSLVYSKERFELLYKVWWFVIFLSIIVAWWEIITGNHLTSGASFYSLDEAATGGFYNPNDYSFYLVVSTPIALYFLKNNIFYKAVTIFMLISIFYVIFVNGSRFALMLFLLTIGIKFSKLLKHNLKLALLLALAISISSFVFSDVILQAFADISTIQTGDDSSKVRLYFTHAALDIFKENLLGVGPGNLELHLGFKAHNYWVEMLVNYGIFIFLGLVSFIVITVVSFIKSKNEEIKRVVNPLLWATILFVPGAIISSSIFQMAFVWFLYGCIICGKNLIEKNKGHGNGILPL